MKRLLIAGSVLAGLVGIGSGAVRAGGHYDWHGRSSGGWRHSFPSYDRGYGSRRHDFGRPGRVHRPHVDHPTPATGTTTQALFSGSGGTMATGRGLTSVTGAPVGTCTESRGCGIVPFATGKDSPRCQRFNALS